MLRLLSIFLLSFSTFSLAADKFKTISIDEVDALLVRKSSVHIYDANVESTRKNVGIIPGARLLESSSDYDIQKELPTDKSSRLIFYCANTMCTASHMAAERAVAAGYTDVSVMKDGIYGWKKAGKTLAKVNQTTPAAPENAVKIDPKKALFLAQKGKAVIVDVREEEERHEIIENSKSFPMSKVGDLQAWNGFKAKLPKDEVVIFHCAAGFRAKRAADKLAAEGVKAMFFEGPDQWKKAGLPVVKGPAN